MALKQNTWTLNQWYDQDVAGNVSYSGELALMAWGSNEIGQMGINLRGNPGGGNYYSSPVQIPGTTWDGSKFKSYKNHAGCIKTDGTLWMWGWNEVSQLGQNDLTRRSSPVQVPGTTWSTLTRSSTSWQSGAIKTDGTLWLWGLQSYYCS